MGDLDGDGDLDLFVHEHVYGHSAVYLNDGTGTFTDTGQQLLPSKLNGGLALGDLDGDGDLDAWVRAHVTPETILENDGAGYFTVKQIISVPAGDTNFDAVALGDFDGDGDLDAVVNANGQYVLFENDPTGTFTFAGAFGTGQAYRIKAGDLDDDGDLDFAVGQWASTMPVFLNDGSANFTQQDYSDNARYIALGDIDMDGDLDRVGVIDGWAASTVMVNDGAGAFTEGCQTWTWPAWSVYNVALGDLDDDGDLDAFIADRGLNALGGGSHVWFNQTAQVPVDIDCDGIADTDPGNYGPADSDGDGVPDDQDTFPNDPTEWADNDGDGIGDNADPDDDNDGHGDDGHDED